MLESEPGWCDLGLGMRDRTRMYGRMLDVSGMDVDAEVSMLETLNKVIRTRINEIPRRGMTKNPLFKSGFGKNRKSSQNRPGVTSTTKHNNFSEESPSPTSGRRSSQKPSETRSRKQKLS